MLLWTLGYRYLFKLMFSFSSDIYPGVEFTGSYGNSIFSFLWRNLWIVFHSGCTNVHSHQQYLRLPSILHPCQHLLFLVFLLRDILTGVRWHLIVVLICIFLMTSNAEHLFMCLLDILTSSLEKCLCQSSAHFSIKLLVFDIESYVLFTHVEFQPLNSLWYFLPF